ncbi:MAG TPA: ATP-binding protein [Longimicrobiales bacterium]|nr:ATP-binding protein [Longimicrobiales bacterium]
MAVLERLRAVSARARAAVPGGSLRRRLIAWFLVFSLFPLLASNMVGYVQSQRIVRRLVERYLSAVAELEARHVRDQVDRHVLELSAVTSGNEFLAAAVLRGGEDAGEMGAVADSAALRQYLERKLGDLHDFEMLYVERPTGELVTWVGSGPPPPAAPEPLLPGLDRLASRPGDAPRMRIAAPVRRHGRVIGRLVGIIPVRALPVFLEIPEHIAGNIESFIVDADGRPVFVSHAHGPVDWDAPLRTPLTRLPPRQAAEYHDRAGVAVVGTSVPIPGLPWRYVVEVAQEDALGPLHQLQRLSLGLEALLVLTLVLTAWLVARGVTAPIRRLAEATRRVGRGEPAPRVAEDSGGELGELQRAFNEMAAEIAAAAARVEELHRREIGRAEQLATVGELASGLAHEVKNPLVGMSNGLDLVRRRIGDDPAVSPIVDEMSRQVGRMEAAVRDLLSFARPTVPRLEPVDANRVATRAARLVQPAAERSGVAVRLALAPDLPVVLADEELLRQALVNLLMNAVQATPADGQVTLSTEAAGSEVRFAVRDTGRGIPPGELEHIFKPFFTTRHAGTGLGLPITREIVERHGGRIEVATQIGKGSTFAAVLPALPAEDPAAEAATEGAAHG